MDSQVILHNLATEAHDKPIVVIKRDDVAKMLKYVESLERALADMLRFTYERKRKPAA
jgi:hypothetical protein